MGAANLDLFYWLARTHELRWALWAAKESAYKAIARQEPETVFSPREFEAVLAPLPWAGEPITSRGRVSYRERSWELEERFDGLSVHAVARDPAAPGGRLLIQHDIVAVLQAAAQ